MKLFQFAPGMMQARAFGKDLQPAPFIEGCEICMYESISIAPSIMQSRAFGKDLQLAPSSEGCEICMYGSISIRTWYNAGPGVW